MTSTFPITISSPQPNILVQKRQWYTLSTQPQPILMTAADSLQSTSTSISTLPVAIQHELTINPYFTTLRSKSSSLMDKYEVKDPNMLLFLNLNSQAAQPATLSSITSQPKQQLQSSVILQPTRGTNNAHTIQTTQQHIENEQSRRLYVGSFDSALISESLLREIFKSFGPIESIIYSPSKITDFSQPQQNAYAFIQYEQVQHVYDALSCMGEYKVGHNPVKNFKIALPTNVKTETFFDLKSHPLQPDMKSKWDLVVEVGRRYNLFSDATYSQLLECFQPEQKTYKIYVGGGFSTSYGEDDLYNLFSGFGKIAKISLIKKSDGTHKGFAFIDFYEQEAANRAKSLQGEEIGGKKLLVSDSNRDASDEVDGSGVPFDYDITQLLVPDPLKNRYPHLPELRPSTIPNQSVRITNLYPYEEWLNKTQNDKDVIHRELSGDMASFGVVLNTKIVIEPFDSLSSTASSTMSDQYIVCLYVQFSSIIEARRCILTVNNRTFENRPVTATYTMKKLH